MYRGGDGATKQEPGEYGLVASRHEQEGGVFRVDYRTGGLSVCYLYVQREKQGVSEERRRPVRRLHDAVQVTRAGSEGERQGEILRRPKTHPIQEGQQFRIVPFHDRARLLDPQIGELSEQLRD